MRSFFHQKSIRKVSDSQFLKTGGKKMQHNADSLWNSKMSEEVTLRPRECGKKGEEEFPGRGRGPFGRTEMKGMEMGTVPGKVWGKENRWV